MAAGVIANVVGIVRKLHRIEELKCSAIEDFRGTVNAIGGVQTVSRSIEKQSLRLRQTRQRPDSLAGLQIDHFYSIIAQGGREETLTLDIHTEVTHASIDVWQGDVGF
jgi:hypothetical protein